MVIEKNKVVSLVYELQVDGEVIESLNEDRPLTFIYGTGALLPKFEANISGLKVGDAFSFELKSEDAYGLATEDAVVEIPKSVFEIDGEFDNEMVKEGNAIPMMDGEGNRLNGVVVAVNAETITMDFNHPLAGDDLSFKGSVVEVREASAEELEHGHIHAAGGCGEGCNSDCSSDEGCCGGGCN
ncbi:MAG: peptidylprolyl isomerase [Bacteroidota bacterium]|nr:peptidylprolyl isomerase [Bacteroidota bacterium]